MKCLFVVMTISIVPGAGSGTGGMTIPATATFAPLPRHTHHLTFTIPLHPSSTPNISPIQPLARC